MGRHFKVLSMTHGFKKKKKKKPWVCVYRIVLIKKEQRQRTS